MTNRQMTIASKADFSSHLADCFGDLFRHMPTIQVAKARVIKTTTCVALCCSVKLRNLD